MHMLDYSQLIRRVRDLPSFQLKRDRAFDLDDGGKILSPFPTLYPPQNQPLIRRPRPTSPVSLH
jgi:hypothetical protein